MLKAMTWTDLLPWRRRAREAAAAATAAAAAQAAEREAAVRRILEAARRNDGPGWAGPTVPLDNRPLMTRAARYRAGGRPV